MKSISGQVVCKNDQQIPVGSVAYIYIQNGDKVVGHTTLQSIDHFPFDYCVDLSDDLLNEPGNTMRVSIENGENVVFFVKSIPIDNTKPLDKFNLEVSHFDAHSNH